MFTPPEHRHAVTEGGKIYWNVRNRLGQFCRADGSNRAATNDTLDAWVAYLHARYQKALQATRGQGLREAYIRPGARIPQQRREVLDFLKSTGKTQTWQEFARHAQGVNDHE
jgi:phytoene dehydrogenase-like protein